MVKTPLLAATFAGVALSVVGLALKSTAEPTPSSLDNKSATRESSEVRATKDYHNRRRANTATDRNQFVRVIIRGVVLFVLGMSQIL